MAMVDEIIRVAKLANLQLSDDEIQKYAKDMEDIVNFANTVNNVNTEGVDEAIGITGNCNAFRKDEIKNFNDREALLKNAPEQEYGMFKIPKVIN